MNTTDHQGRAFSTIGEKCTYWGVNEGTYNSRIKNGCSEEEALTGNIDRPTYKNRQKSLDNIEARTGLTGKVYETEKAMVRAEAVEGVSYGLYKKRQANGWTKKKALKTPKVYKRGTYEEFVELGISKDFVLRSRNRGWSDTKIKNNRGLGLKPQVSKRYSEIKDRDLSITGVLEDNATDVIYECKCEQCKGVYAYTYKDMMSHKCYDPYKLLPQQEKKIIEFRDYNAPTTDHLGQSFESYYAMFKFYGITKSLFYSRIKAGWSLEATLLLSKGVRYNPCKDMYGTTWWNEDCMCAYYGVKKRKYEARKKRGYSIEDCLKPDRNREQEFLLSLGIPLSTQKNLRAQGYSVLKMQNTLGIGSFVRHNERIKEIEEDLGISIEAMSFETDTNVWYKCECRKCGMKDIWKYEDMLKHSQVCK